MATSSAAEEMERLQLSDEDTEDLWNSPSQRRAKTVNHKPSKPNNPPTDRPENRNSDTLFDQEEAREAALRSELHNVRNVNQAIEGVLESLDRARGNMEVCFISPLLSESTLTRPQTVSRTVNSASTLLNTWTRILSQTEHNQRLILNTKWQGATNDIAEIENDAAAKQQAVERREQEMRQRREAAARKAEEEEKKRVQAASASASRGSRGVTRGRVRGGLARTPSVSSSAKGTAGVSRTTSTSTTSRERPGSGIARGPAPVRGRGKP
jgi:hypothetical protein